MQTPPRRWILLAIAAIVVAIVLGTVLVRTITRSSGPRVEEKKGVVAGAERLARRVRILAGMRLSKVFVTAATGEEQDELNEESMPPTPHDPSAEPAQSTSFQRADASSTTRPQDSTPDDVVVYDETIVDRGHASHIAEPNVATDGRRVLSVWNWGAAASTNGGKTFQYLDPRSLEAGKATPLPFCCDQLAYYVPSRDLWIWLLQYRGPDGTRSRNIIRIAYAIGGEAFDRGQFAVFDLAAHDIAGKPSQSGRAIDGNAYLDFSRIASTDANLFVTVNVFPTLDNAYVGSVVVRVPLADLVAHRPRADWYLTDRATAGLTSGAHDTMYFATHVTDSTLEVCKWADAAGAPSCANVEHSPHSATPRGEPYRCLREGAPPTSDWCERLTEGRPGHDDRPLSGWVAGGLIGFAWDARQDPVHGFPYPFTAVLRIDEKTMALHDEPIIWRADRAYAYTAITPNARGDLGAVSLIGGGTHYPTCVVLVRSADAPSDSGWQSEAIVDVSESDSVRPASGDYLGVFPNAPGSNTWMGSCMTLHGGGEEEDVEIRVFSFGRTADRGG